MLGAVYSEERWSPMSPNREGPRAAAPLSCGLGCLATVVRVREDTEWQVMFLGLPPALCFVL